MTKTLQQVLSPEELEELAEWLSGRYDWREDIISLHYGEIPYGMPSRVIDAVKKVHNQTGGDPDIFRVENFPKVRI